MEPLAKRLRPSSVEYMYLVTIEVLDTKLAGWDADIKLAFYDNEVWTKQIAIKDGLKTKRTGKDIFQVAMPALNDITLMSLTRTSGLFSQWFIGKIEVERQSTDEKYFFPVNKWIKKGKEYNIYEKRYATSLPQNDPNKELRSDEVQEQAKQYVYDQKSKGGLVLVKDAPPDEWFTSHLSYTVYLAKRFASTKFDSIRERIEDKFNHIIWSSKWKSFADIAERLYITDDFPKPESVDVWQQDEYFGQLRLTGANHSVIKLCKSVPEKLFGNGSTLKKQDLKKLLEGSSVEAAIEQKKLFIVDYEILDGLQHIKKGFHLCAPVALFYVNKSKKLMPVAIQLEQKPSPSNPVFLPTDNKYLWMMAKMWFNNSDASYHESVAHLGFTHMLVEGFVITTHRNFDDKHPLYKLLLPHFLFLIQINQVALNFLIEPNGWVDEAMNIGHAGMHELIAKRLKTWRLDVDGNLPEELKSRGVFEDVLPHYYYKDDALDLWNIIMKYVTSYVTLYYGEGDAPTSLTQDFELQNWAQAIAAPRCQGQGLLGVPGVPDDEATLKDKSALCNILTSIIFTSSVVHASVNFMQYEQYGFPPAYPSYLSGVPPTSKKNLEERDVLDALPDFKTSVDVMDITQLLSGFGTHKLGDFPTPYITDPTALPVVKQFQQDLAKLSGDITKKNKKRGPVYDFLNPVNIPNAISI